MNINRYFCLLFQRLAQCIVLVGFCLVLVGVVQYASVRILLNMSGLCIICCGVDNLSSMVQLGLCLIFFSAPTQCIPALPPMTLCGRFRVPRRKSPKQSQEHHFVVLIGSLPYQKREETTYQFRREGGGCAHRKGRITTTVEAIIIITIEIYVYVYTFIQRETHIGISLSLSL